MVKDRRGVIIAILIAVIVVLALVMIFLFVVKPGFNKYVFNKQVQAQSYVFSDMLTQLQTNGFYKFSIGNQSIILVPYIPPQAAA